MILSSQNIRCSNATFKHRIFFYRDFARLKNRLGFTMIELILVIVVLSVVAGISIPNFGQTYSKVLLRQSVSDLSYLMRYAQSRAVTKSKTIYLQFNEEMNQYWLTEEIVSTEDDANEEIEFGKIAGRMGRVSKIPVEVNIQIENPGIYFFPDGTMDKTRFEFCSANVKTCYLISTQEMRGQVQVFEVDKNE